MNVLIIILAFVILACSKIKAASVQAWKQAQDKAGELAASEKQGSKVKKGGRNGK